jgi:hypothetical protein
VRFLLGARPDVPIFGMSIFYALGRRAVED